MSSRREPRARPRNSSLRVAAVDVGRVEEGDAGVESGVHHRGRLVVVDAPSEVVAAEADDRDVERADLASSHQVVSLSWAVSRQRRARHNRVVAGPPTHADRLAGRPEQGTVLRPQVGEALAESVGEGVHLDVAQDPFGGHELGHAQGVVEAPAHGAHPQGLRHPARHEVADDRQGGRRRLEMARHRASRTPSGRPRGGRRARPPAGPAPGAVRRAPAPCRRTWAGSAVPGSPREPGRREPAPTFPTGRARGGRGRR